MQAAEAFQRASGSFVHEDEAVAQKTARCNLVQSAALDAEQRVFHVEEKRAGE